MDLKKYDKLRKKINTKDFEGNNKSLDWWLYYFSFVGNLSSIFFAYFLLYPSLHNAVTLHVTSGGFGEAISHILTIVLLSMFEIVKRYFIRNFSNDYLSNRKKLDSHGIGWLVASILIIVTSFYISISGSKNFGTTSVQKNVTADYGFNQKNDSIVSAFEAKIKIYIDDNAAIRNANIELGNKLREVPVEYISVMKNYQQIIDKNLNSIANNDAKISKLDDELKNEIKELRSSLNTIKSDNSDEDSKNILLFIVIVIFNEVIIIGGICFREYYEHKLYELNYQKYEKFYQKRDRYRSLLKYVFGDGKLTVGDKVISGLELKELVREKSTIVNSNKLVDEFLRDMDTLGIFTTNGKRRMIAMQYHEALSVVENYDDALRILENLK